MYRGCVVISQSIGNLAVALALLSTSITYATFHLSVFSFQF